MEHQLARQAIDALSAFDGYVCDGATGIALIDPDRNCEIARLREDDADEVARSVANAKGAFEDRRWAGKTVAERARILRTAASAIRAEADSLAALDSLSTGLLYHSSTRRHASACADWFDYFAGLAAGERPMAFATSAQVATQVVREPVGVVALFTPWNIPLMAAGLKLAAALAMGNCVVIKPSELSPLGTIRLVEILREAGLPDGVLHLVNGRGSVTGKALADHPNIAAISFTGGPVAGSSIAQTAAARFAKVTMELGGKSANIVLADAPYDAALDGTLTAAFGNSGQACLAGSRVLVEAPLADRFIADLVARAEALRIGRTFDAAAEIGPQSSEAQMHRVLAYADRGGADGGELLCGGRRADGFAGFQVEPGIIHVTDNRAAICQEEVFGPLITVQIVDSDEQAVAVANDTPFGLAGYVWSADPARAASVAAGLRTGTVIINSPFLRERGAPFGGFNASGVDREGGRWSLDFYSEAKAIITRSWDGAKPT